MLNQIGLNIFSNVLSIPFIAILVWLIYKGIMRTQFGRFVVWWLLSGRKFRTAPKTVLTWYRLITHSINLVEENLGVSRTFQGSPIGMPLATCSVDFYRKVMYMVWLSIQPDNTLYKEITTGHRMNNGEIYYDWDNKEKFDEWSKNLLASYEGDFGQIEIIKYSDFIYVFEDTLFHRHRRNS